MTRAVVRRTCLGLALVSCLMLSGCSGKVNKANYDKVNTGMTVSEVEGILGKGEEQASTGVGIPGIAGEIPGVGNIAIPGGGMSAKVVKWQDGNRIITITFVGDKVMTKVATNL